MGSMAEWRGQRKESVSQETDQKTNKGNTEEKKNEHSLSDLWDGNNLTLMSLGSREEEKQG